MGGADPVAAVSMMGIMDKAVVCYLRVSTERQGRSGLGLDAQRNRCHAFAAQNAMEVAETFTEVETGKGSDALDRRPQLAAALAAARRRRCPVLIAKLDRLSRDVHFISGLMVQRVQFLVAEPGDAGRVRDPPHDRSQVRGQDRVRSGGHLYTNLVTVCISFIYSFEVCM